MNDDLKKLREICSEGWVGGRSPDEVSAMHDRVKINNAVDSLYELLNLVMNEGSTIIIEKLKSIISELEED